DPSEDARQGAAGTSGAGRRRGRVPPVTPGELAPSGGRAAQNRQTHAARQNGRIERRLASSSRGRVPGQHDRARECRGSRAGIAGSVSEDQTRRTEVAGTADLTISRTTGPASHPYTTTR